MDRVPGPVARFARRNPVVSRMFKPLVNRLVPERPQTVTVRSGPARGLRIVIMPREEKFYWAGTYEPEVQRALSETLAPGATYWDVGAHAGFFACLASRLVGPDGRVIAFEPSPENLERLHRAVEMNAAANIRVEPIAVAAQSGAAALYSHEHSSMWSLEASPEGGSAGTVPTRTLDELAAELPAPDLIKVDVEGGEIDVLSGGKRLLHEDRPTLLVEFHSDAILAQARALLDGYRFRRLGEAQWLLTALPGPDA